MVQKCSEMHIELQKVQEEARIAEFAKEKAEALASGNPLLDLKDGGDDAFVAKRRWDDDVVFKNQTRGEPRTKKRFVNDTIRSDFHRRFLNKYIK